MSCLQYYVLTLSLGIVYKTVMVVFYSLYGCLLSEGSVVATLEAAEDAQRAGLVYMQHKTMSSSGEII